MSKYLHDHNDFTALINITADEKNIEAGLIEKDYWIMQVLSSLKKQGFEFELKGGTSLSKGYKIIHRFSEDIDIHIKPPKELGINENPNNCKENNVRKRKEFYDWLAKEIKIPGIIAVERDTTFDEQECYRSGGIRLYYQNLVNVVAGVKEGILLEVGFDDVTPNNPLTISSWAFDRAIGAKVEVIDNRAFDIICYDPGYTLVEKLQTIATKYRNEQTKGINGVNFMRQYYDVYCLLDSKDVLEFIGTHRYEIHKKRRFPKVDYDLPIHKNEAFLLSNGKIRNEYTARYKKTAALYYQGQPTFEELLLRIKKHIKKL